MILGLGSWLAGPWGVKGSLADAALPPPYTMEVFLHRLSGWVGSLQPLITFPLILLAIGWVIYRARKDRRPADTFGTVFALWLLPLLGVFGWVAGSAYPYYRFMNATAALMPLLGLGLWVVVRWLLSRRGGTAAVAVAAREPGRPIVFILNFGDTYQAYGWAKTFTNVSRTGLPGDAVKRSMSYFGSVQDFLASRPTELTDPTYNKMSRGFFAEVQALELTYPQPPVVFLVRQFNGNTENAALLDQI